MRLSDHIYPMFYLFKSLPNTVSTDQMFERNDKIIAMSLIIQQHNTIFNLKALLDTLF